LLTFNDFLVIVFNNNLVFYLCYLVVIVLKKIDCYDCYHTFEYHHLSKLKGELPILIYYEGKTGKIAFPLLKRKIPKYDFYDCTSVYGYVGPIFTPNIDEIDLSFFQIAIAKFFKKEKIISVFSRLNPFLVSQEKSLTQLGKIETLGKVIFIDLRENNRNQRLGYSKTTKRYLNKSRKFCSIKKEFDQEDILIFKNLYYENMNRVNANSYYYFEESYFQQLLQAKEFTTDVKYVINNDTEEIIAGAIFIKSKHVIHYHLSGTKTEFLHLNPLRLLIDEMRLENPNYKEYAYFKNLVIIRK